MAYKKQEETKVQKAIQNYIRSIGGYCFKEHADMFSRAGIPDIICCVKGRFIGIEAKDGDNTASDLQIANGILIKKAGGLFIIAKSVEEVQNLLEKENLI